MDTSEKIKKLLGESYLKLRTKELSRSEKIQLLDHIINLKLTNDLENHGDYITNDVTKLIDFSINKIDDTDSSYNQIDKDYLRNLFLKFEIEQQCSFLTYTIRLLNQKGDIDNILYFVTLRNEAKGYLLVRRFKWNNYRKYLGLIKIATSQKKYFFISVLVYLIVLVSILLPSNSSNPTFILFEFIKRDYSNNFLLNHILNCLFGLLEIDEMVIIKPLNIGGLFLILLNKIYLTLIIGSLLLKLISDKLEEAIWK